MPLGHKWSQEEENNPDGGNTEKWPWLWKGGGLGLQLGLLFPVGLKLLYSPSILANEY